MSKPMFKLVLALFVVAFAAIASVADAAIYLKMDGIDGEVTTRDFEKQIEVQSIQFGVHNQPAANRGTGGAGAGKAQFSDVVITKLNDKASTRLFLAAASGQNIKKVVLSFTTKPGKDGPTTYMTITLENVLVSSYSISSGGDRPVESISLSFTKVEIETKSTNEKGVPTTTGKASWDVQTNKGG